MVNKSCTNLIKLFLAMFVVLHHLFNCYPDINLFTSTSIHLLGTLSVGGFYFLSGYGINESYRSNGTSYLRKICFKKIPLLYLLIIISNLFYLLVYSIKFNVKFSLLDILCTAFYITSAKTHYANVFSWIYFVFYLMFYYLTFVILSLIFERISKKHSISKNFNIYAYVALACLIYIIISFITKKPFDCRTFLLFPIGALYSACKDYIPKKNFVVIISATLFCISLVFSNNYFIAEQITPIFFCFMLMTIFRYVKAEYKLLNKYSLISMITYIIHKFFILVFSNYMETNPFLFILLVFIATFISGVIINTLMLVCKKKLLILKNRQFKTS